MAEDSGNRTTVCQGIDEILFDLGCLAPALLIILVLASLRHRINFKLEHCNGHPGLLIPINFLGGFSNRFTIAATFGATASTCLMMFLNQRTGLFHLPGPAWVKVFQSIIAVLVYGILFYPFFACLTTEYKLLGSFMGFLYVTMRFCFRLAIDFHCASTYVGETKKLFYVLVLGFVPTYLCIFFILVRFAVLLYFEVRKKWFPTTSARRGGGEISDTRLAKEPEIAHIKELINPGSVSDFEEMKWYPKLLYPIYKPRKDFVFSTQLISTMLVCGITVYQVLVTLLAFFDLLRRVYIQACATDTCKNAVDVLLGGIEGGLVVSALVSVLLLLHFMKCHREHVLQMYRGETSFSRDVYVSPAALVGKSLRFSGYQIAYSLIGYFTLSCFLSIVTIVLAAIFKNLKSVLSPQWLAVFEDIGLGFLPTVGVAVFLVLFQLFLAHFVFRDRTYPNITVAIDNRRLFSIMSYFFFFYNILLGMFSCSMRILKGMFLGVIFISRIDRSSLMQGFQTWDKAFVAYLGFVTVLVAHRHPVMLVFCQLLLDRNKDQQPLQEQAPTRPKQRSNFADPERSAERMGVLNVNRPVTNYSAFHRREPRLPRMSQKAVNRWFLAVTLLRNPSLVKYRCQRRAIRPVVSLGSINIGDQI
ncbi:hypothetical protein ACROYT_G032433 [Oculina patagonica]